MPPIRLVYASPHTKQGNTEVRSKAYAVEFARKDATVVLRMLKDTFSGSKSFLMAKLRYTHPQSYSNALKLQNQHLAVTYILPLINMGKEALYYIEDRIKAIQGVTDVIPTRRTDTSGRYNILIKKQLFKQVKAQLIFPLQMKKHSGNQNDPFREPDVGVMVPQHPPETMQATASINIATSHGPHIVKFPSLADLPTNCPSAPTCTRNPYLSGPPLLRHQ
jgi:hypothetical protein